MCGRRPRCKRNLAFGLRSGASHVSGLLMRHEPLALMCSADWIPINFSGSIAQRPQSGRNTATSVLSTAVGDVQATNGAIRSRIVTAQRKVSKAKRCQPVEVDVPQRARDALARMIASEGKTAKGFLFTHPRRPHGEPLCRKQLARLVKRWATEIGMDTHRIAAHTMRRTRPTIAIRKGLATLVHVRHWLGHNDIAVTTGYVGIEAEDALQVSAQCAL
jgi:site-specific recombinase XerD